MSFYSKRKFESLFVEDQEKALSFYIEILGMEKKHDWPAGQFRWLTIVPESNNNDQEILLEPSVDPKVKAMQSVKFQQGVPAICLFTDNLIAEYQRLKSAGVYFALPPTKTEQNQIVAIFDDTCGNLIQLVQE